LRLKTVATALVGPALVAALLVLGMPQAGASPSTLYVSPSGSDSNPCTKSAPCATITHAVSVATPGDTISVAAGTYTEDVSVSIRLRLIGSNHPVVDASGLSNGFFVHGSGAAGTTVAGFTVENAQFEGILINRTKYVTIRNNLVMHNDLGMFNPHPVGECAPVGEIPGDCGEGVHLLSVTHSAVLSNRITGNSGGILLTDESGPTVRNLIAENSVVKNLYDCGITIAGHNTGAVSGSGVPQPSVAGVYANAIVHNVANGNGRLGEGAGILLAGGAPGTGVYDNFVAYNVAKRNDLAGLTLHSHAPGQDLNGNVITNNLFVHDNLGGDPDAGVSRTAGVVIWSAVTELRGTVVRSNTIGNVYYGIWTQNVPHIAKSANTFFNVVVPVHQQ